MIHDLVKQLNQPESRDRRLLKANIDALNKELELARERELEADIAIVKANEVVRLQKSQSQKSFNRFEGFTQQEKQVMRDALKTLSENYPK